MNQFDHSPLPAGTDGSLGHVDRYELRERLAEGPAGMLYRGIDTVVGTPVSLLFLPAALTAAPGALDGLRAELTPVARFRHPGVAHLLHLTQLWDLDAVARAETGLEPGAAALVADFPAGEPLPAWRRQFPHGRMPIPQLLDLVWELAEALDGLHAADLVHGSLTAEDIRMTARGPVLVGAALGGRVRAAMARLGLGNATSVPPDSHDDLQALVAIAQDLLPDLPAAPWAEVMERAMRPAAESYPSARQFAGALRTACEAVPDLLAEEPPEEEPPAAAAPAPLPELVPPPSPVPATHAVFYDQPAAKPAGARRTSRVLNIVLVVAVLVLLALVVKVVLSRRQAPVPVETGESWEPVKQSTRLSPAFAWRVTLPAVAPGQMLRFRLYGQTRVLAVVAAAEGIVVTETTGKGDRRELASVALTEPLTEGEVLAVAKSPDALTVARNGVVVAQAPCPLETWRLARWDQAGGLVPIALTNQKIERLVFADDFMHGDSALGEWQPESGQWTVHELQNPIRSANPFSFLGTGSNALARAGQWFWRNYQLTCSAHPLKDSAFGVSFCHLDAGQTYNLRWRKAGETGVLELTRRKGGESQSLARRELPFLANSWVGLSVSQLDGLLVVAVDGHEVFRVVDPAPLLGGGIGLWTDGGEGTVFDDVVVTPVDRLAITQADVPASLLPSGQLATTAGLPDCPLGGVLLENATVTMAVPLVGRSAPVGLFARRNGPKDLRFQLVPGARWQAQIVGTTPAGETVVASEEMASPKGEGELSFTVLNREAWGMVDGQIVVYAGQVPVLGRGRAGAFAAPESPVQPTRLAIAPATALPNIDNRVETFTHEQSMQNWNSPVLFWTPDYTSKLPLYWHRSDFWRDVSVRADVAELEKLDGVQTWGVALSEEGTAAGHADRRWELFLVPGPKPQLYLSQPGAEPEALPLEGTVQTLALERRGNLLLAKRNGRTIWDGRVTASSDGLMRVGRIGRGATDEWALAVEIRADSVRTYSFKEAPVDWLPASGEWQVTNRWQCDPRWSFFSGVQRGGAACLWNKYRHGDNVTIEFFVGPKMDRERGKWYEYAADFNAVICADGSDIASGYSFLFGGWDDRGSQIVRQHEILAENRRIVIPRQSSTHRRWFHVKLRKRGAQLTSWVDGALVGSVQDEAPLAGDRFGLWTWGNGIMVAQVRVATDGAMESVGMDAAPNPQPKTPYDK